MSRYYTLTYQSLTIRYEDPKALGSRMRDLREQGVKSVTLTPKGIHYTTGRVSIFVGNINYQHHEEAYPDGVTATGKHSVEVDTKRMHKMLGSYAKPPKAEQKPIHRRWMTPEQYERQKALHPTVGSMLSR